MEYQARLRDNRKFLDIAIEAKSGAYAIMKAHRARNFIQDRAEPTAVSLLNVSEVIRHSDGLIEHQPIWQAPSYFLIPNRKATV